MTIQMDVIIEIDMKIQMYVIIEIDVRMLVITAFLCDECA